MKNRFMIILFCSWAVIGLGILGKIHGQHLITFFAPEKVSNEMVTELKKDFKFGTLHILSEGCGCSDNVLQYLKKRGPLKDIQETIIYVGKIQEKSQLVNSGFIVKEVLIEDIEKFEIRAVPILVIYDQSNTTHYIGGYSDKMITPLTKMKDIELVKNLKNKQKVDSLPIKGCSVSRKFQKILDPLGLKYRS